jgi:hypothetical protein
MFLIRLLFIAQTSDKQTEIDFQTNVNECNSILCYSGSIFYNSENLRYHSTSNNC